MKASTRFFLANGQPEKVQVSGVEHATSYRAVVTTKNVTITLDVYADGSAVLDAQREGEPLFARLAVAGNTAKDS